MIHRMTLDKQNSLSDNVILPVSYLRSFAGCLMYVDSPIHPSIVVLIVFLVSLPIRTSSYVLFGPLDIYFNAMQQAMHYYDVQFIAETPNTSTMLPCSHWATKLRNTINTLSCMLSYNGALNPPLQWHNCKHHIDRGKISRRLCADMKYAVQAIHSSMHTRKLFKLSMSF
jgi:hypothetical protein